ncbi:MAG: DUF2304 domain-containing protein [Candidatus Avilachnospira sp.]|jgi:hypothetical protein
MMTTLFRMVLIIVSVGTFGIIVQKIRRSRMRIEDSIFWVILCLMFVVFALFPKVADGLAALLGIYSTANFLFLFTIFILLMKLFSMSMTISTLETKIKELAQEMALEKTERRADENGEFRENEES